MNWDAISRRKVPLDHHAVDFENYNGVSRKFCLCDYYLFIFYFFFMKKMKRKERNPT